MEEVSSLGTFEHWVAMRKIAVIIARKDCGNYRQLLDCGINSMLYNSFGNFNSYLNRIIFPRRFHFFDFFYVSNVYFNENNHIFTIFGLLHGMSSPQDWKSTLTE